MSKGIPGRIGMVALARQCAIWSAKTVRERVPSKSHQEYHPGVSPHPRPRSEKRSSRALAAIDPFGGPGDMRWRPQGAGRHQVRLPALDRHKIGQLPSLQLRRIQLAALCSIESVLLFLEAFRDGEKEKPR